MSGLIVLEKNRYRSRTMKAGPHFKFIRRKHEKKFVIFWKPTVIFHAEISLKNRLSLNQMFKTLFGMFWRREKCTKFVSHILSSEQKTKQKKKKRRVDACRNLIEIAANEKCGQFFSRKNHHGWRDLVLLIWTYHKTTKYRMGSLRSKNVRMTKSKMKTMLIVFLDVHGIYFYRYYCKFPLLFGVIYY